MFLENLWIYLGRQTTIKSLRKLVSSFHLIMYYMDASKDFRVNFRSLLNELGDIEIFFEIALLLQSDLE